MNDNRLSTVLSILILVAILGAAYYMARTIQQSTQQALAPFQQANSGLQTQVSDLLHPTPTVIPDPVTYINKIQALARLETIQYSIEQVVTVETNQGPFAFISGNKMLLQVHGTVIAGIDMQKLKPGDMQLQNGVLTVTLPPSEVFTTTLDESKTQVYTLQSGIFSKPSSGLVLPGLVGAKDKILQAALDDGILEQAQKNAIAYLAQFFSALGYQNTIFQSTPAD